jgi:hypothetical protein
MATYKELHGQAVKDVASDPTNTGEIFYNSSTDTFRSIVISKAWHSATALPSVVTAGAGAFGTQTEGVVAGGLISASINTTSEYNGSGWSGGGNLNTARHALAGTGTETAGLCFGGKVDPGGANPANVEEYNGTAWSEVTDQPQALMSAVGAGTQTAGLSIGGQTGPSSPSRINNVYHYDGTNWTDGGALPTATTSMGAGGTLTAAIAFGGRIPPDTLTGNTYEYDGSSWTTSPGSMNTSRFGLGGCGTQTSALAFGGSTTPDFTAYSAKTEEYDGTTWSEVTDLPAGTYTPAGFGTSTAAVSASGGVPGGTTAVNEWNVSTNVITAAAWASSNNMNTARSYAGGMLGSDSTQSAGMAFGGQDSTGVLALNEEYDGSSWSESGDLGTARRWHYGAGSQTAALCAGGVAAAAATPVTSNTEEYDGSSWSEVTNMGTGRYNGGSGGTQTAAYVTGGSPAPSYTNATEEYDGTNWTAGGDMLVSKGYYGGGGTQTAGIVMGIGSGSTASYHYNGSSWTAGGTMNRGCSQGTYAGLQTDGIAFGGTPPTTATEGYDGTAWSTRPSMATARYALAGSSGTAASALGAGGFAPPFSNSTEEFTGETTAANVKTITTS